MNWLPYILAFVCIGGPTAMLAVALWDCVKTERLLKELSKNL